MRAAAFGVVGVEGCVGRGRSGSRNKSGNSGGWKLIASGVGSGVGEGAIEVSGVGDGAIELSGVAEGAIELSGVAEGAIELSGVAEGAIELSGVADTYQDELGEFMRNSESFLNGWLKVLLCAGFCC
jgi:hypothetical protein